MSVAPGTKLGPYLIVERLGAGGMGEVYRARDTRLDRHVAVKVLPTAVAANADALDRFQREAKAVAALSHPNILALYDIGDDHDTAYIVTELLDGEILRVRLAAGPIPRDETIDLAASMADGLAAAHEKGIVHRDLKPENIFVTSDGHVKIAGLADLQAVMALYGHAPPPIAFAKAGASANRALAIDERLAEGHFSSAGKTWLYDFDWTKGEQQLRRALELNPQNPIAHIWLAHLLTSLGRTDEATRERARAQDLDPLSTYVTQAGLGLVCERRHEEALVACNKALDVEPEHVLALYVAGGIYSRLARQDEGISALEKAVAIADRASFHVSHLGVALGLAGRSQEAHAILAELETRAASEYVSPLHLAWVLAAVGEMDRAFDHLERAHAERACFLVLPGWTAFDGFRTDPRFDRFVQRMGLTSPPAL